MTSVLHVSATDISGGAGLAAYRLMQAQREAGIDAKMIVASQKSDDPNVLLTKPPTDPLARLKRSLDRRKMSRQRRASQREVLPALEYFSDDRVAGADPLRNLPKADIIHLHWVANLVDYQRFFSNLPAGQPLVWTLHDMNPFTGGCHYSMGCGRYLESCGACPLLGSSVDSDLTREILSRKVVALNTLERSTTLITAPSQWLTDEASRSSILGRFDTQTIPNCLDTDLYKPYDKQAAKQVFGLPENVPAVLFVAGKLGAPRKGLDLLYEAYKSLPENKCVLAAIGEGDQVPAGTKSLGMINDQRLMALAYCAADVFVLPTRADNLPNVLLEAMACGVACVSYRVGGVPDIIDDGVTGVLAEPEDVNGLREGLLALLSDKPRRDAMGAASRAAAVWKFAPRVAAASYLSAYQNLIAASRELTRA